MRLSEIPYNSIARCVLTPAGCPIRVSDIISRNASGTFDPPIPDHPSFTAQGYQRAAEFEVVASGVTEDDFAVLATAKARFERREPGAHIGIMVLMELIAKAREGDRAKANLAEAITAYSLGPIINKAPALAILARESDPAKPKISRSLANGARPDLPLPTGELVMVTDGWAEIAKR